MFFKKVNTSIENKIDLQDLFFRLSMVGKIFYGSWRVVLGLFMFQIIGSPFSDLFLKLLNREHSEDPTDIIIQFINPFLHYAAFPVTYYLAFYILFWGALDVFLGVNLLRHKMWAFPFSLLLIGTFIMYEVYRYFHTHSTVLAIVTAIDIIMFILIYKEYKRLASKKE